MNTRPGLMVLGSRRKQTEQGRGQHPAVASASESVSRSILSLGSCLTSCSDELLYGPGSENPSLPKLFLVVVCITAIVTVTKTVGKGWGDGSVGKCNPCK